VVGVKRILELIALWFVQSKVTLARLFWAVWPLSPLLKSAPWLLNIIVMTGWFRITLLLEFNMHKVNSRHAVVGVRVPQSQRAVRADERLVIENIRRLSPADGRRGRHELNSSSGKFILLINKSFQF
jgi:hypothetical protein